MGVGDILFWPYVLGIGFYLVVAKIIVLAFVIFMVLDCMQRKFKVEAERWIWIFLIVVTTWIGAIAYFISVRMINHRGIAKK